MRDAKPKPVYPTFKPVLRWDPGAKIFRLFRVVRNSCSPADGRHYAWKASLALTPRAFSWRREFHGLIVVLLGLRFHYQRSYGGNYG